MHFPRYRDNAMVATAQPTLEALHTRLSALDPVSAQQLNPADRLRVIRAIEISRLTGLSASTLRAEHAFTPDRYDYRFWVLGPERDALYAAIDAGDVRRRALRGDARWSSRPPATRRQCGRWATFRRWACSRAGSGWPSRSPTRHYAKHQWAWFTKEQGAQFVKPPYAAVLERGPP